MRKRKTRQEIEAAEDAADVRWLRAYRKKPHASVPLEDVIRKVEEGRLRRRGRSSP